MLSLGVVKAGAGAGYHEAAVAGGAEDYYSGAGERAGRWFGRTDLIGRQAGTVADSDEAAALLERLAHPDTGETIGRAVVDEQSVTAIDHTFSAPKSVSAVWALGDGRVRAEVEAAHDAAIEEALGWLSRDRSRTRVRDPETNELRAVEHDGLMGIAYQHRTSRAGDPQLHTHVTVLNRVRHEGRWLTIDSRGHHDAAKAAGARYQAALRAELSTRLGVEFGEVTEHAQAEIEGVPQELLDQWSSRSREVDTALADWLSEFRASEGREPDPDEWRKAKQAAVLATRPAKDTDADAATTETLRDRWRAEATAAGIDVDGLVAEATGRTQSRPDQRAWVTPEWFLTQVERERATWQDKHARIEAARWTHGAATAAEAGANIDAWTADALAHPSVERFGDVDEDRPWVGRMATGRMLAIEGEIIDRATNSIDPHAATAAGIDPGRLEGLTDTQAAAARTAADDDHLVVAIEGPAGTGKTTMLGPVVDHFRAEGRTVIGLAPTRRAGDELGEATGIEAETIAAFASGKAPLPPGGVVIVDEAGMVGTQDARNLMAQAEARGCRVIAVGDPRQLAAVKEAGGWLEMVMAQPEAATATLAEPVRFAHEWEAEASIGLRDGDLGAEVTYLLNDRIHASEFGDRVMVNAAVARAWEARQAGKHVELMTDTRANRDALNALLRQERIDAGEIDAGTEIAPGYEISVGDEIRTRRNSHDLGVVNGERWTVTAVGDDGGLVVTDPEKGTRTLPAGYASEHTHHAYAATVHSAQGLTADVGLVVLGGGANREHLYVGLTRGREENHAFLLERERIGEREVPEQRASAADLLGRLGERSNDDARSAHQLRAEAEAERIERERLEREARRQAEREHGGGLGLSRGLG